MSVNSIGNNQQENEALYANCSKAAGYSGPQFR